MNVIIKCRSTCNKAASASGRLCHPYKCNSWYTTNATAMKGGGKSKLYASVSLLTITVVTFVFYSSSFGSQIMRESPLDASNYHHHGNATEKSSGSSSGSSSSCGSTTTASILERKLDILTDSHYKQLQDDGVVVIDNVLTNLELDMARNEVDKMISDKMISINDHNDASVRSDHVIFINESIGKHQRSVLSTGLLQCLRLIRSVPFELKTRGYQPDDMLGVPMSNQLSCYDGNKSNYIAHRDVPDQTVTSLSSPLSSLFFHPLRSVIQNGLSDRKVTIILYLNESTWDSTCNDNDDNDNGNLKCYLGTAASDVTGDTATSIKLIEPVGGRLVIFDSTKILHEVRPSTSRRRAITVWAGGSTASVPMESYRIFYIPYNDICWKNVTFF